MEFTSTLETQLNGSNVENTLQSGVTRNTRMYGNIVLVVQKC